MSQFSTAGAEVGGRDGRKATLDCNFTEIFSHFSLSLLWPHYSENVALMRLLRGE